MLFAKRNSPIDVVLSEKVKETIPVLKNAESEILLIVGGSVMVLRFGVSLKHPTGIVLMFVEEKSTSMSVLLPENA